MGALLSRRGRQPREPGAAGAGGSAGAAAAGGPQPLNTTQTVHNDLNLRKASLRAEPDPTRPGFYLISFTFDANVPCTVAVFFLARELADDGRSPEQGIAIESKLQFRPRVTPRSEGANQPFNQRPEDAIDARANGDSLAHNPSSPFFPLIIRIEAANPSRPKRGRRPCRNSQCTFAALEKTESGFRTKILKQKLLIDGAEIETQEIYGIDPRTDPECVICMTAPKDTAMLPCRHMCMCSACAKVYNHHSESCPICRQRVESMLRITDPQAAPATAPDQPASARPPDPASSGSGRAR